MKTFTQTYIFHNLSQNHVLNEIKIISILEKYKSSKSSLKSFLKDCWPKKVLKNVFQQNSVVLRIFRLFRIYIQNIKTIFRIKFSLKYLNLTKYLSINQRSISVKRVKDLIFNY
jgi:hypothetical protein